MKQPRLKRAGTAIERAARVDHAGTDAPLPDHHALRELAFATWAADGRVPLHYAMRGDAWLRDAWERSRDPLAMLRLATGERHAWIESLAYWGAVGEVTLAVVFAPGYVQPAVVCYEARVRVARPPWTLRDDGARMDYEADVVRRALPPPTFAGLLARARRAA